MPMKDGTGRLGNKKKCPSKPEKRRARFVRHN